MFTNDATVAWRYLNGIICVYKPLHYCFKIVRYTLFNKLSSDLNNLKCRDLRKFVRIEGDTSKPLEVTVEPNLADHTLLVGPRYVPEDFRSVYVKYLGFNTSGVYVLGINNGNAMAKELKESRQISVYHIKARVGLGTRNNFADDIPTYKCNYNYIKKGSIDNVSAGIQAQHQKHLYNTLNVSTSSQAAYEMAANGLIRPESDKIPIIYSIKCIDFSLPEFVLEISAINETEDYLIQVILEIGYQLKNVTSIVSIRCIRHGFFTLEHALLKKHWNLENVFENMRTCYELVEKSRKPDSNLESMET